jgi:hypothetical protein
MRSTPFVEHVFDDTLRLGITHVFSFCWEQSIVSQRNKHIFPFRRMFAASSRLPLFRKTDERMFSRLREERNVFSQSSKVFVWLFTGFIILLWSMSASGPILLEREAVERNFTAIAQTDTRAPHEGFCSPSGNRVTLPKTFWELLCECLSALVKAKK